MRRKQDPRWPNAHVRLKQLYDERIRPSMSEGEFGAEYEIGSQGMVWQYINGYVPLTIEAAVKFSEGLRCTIKDISPEMDKWLQARFLPALGLKKWRRVATVAILAGAAYLNPFNITDANASTSPKLLFKYTLYAIRRAVSMVFMRPLAAL